MNERTRRAVNNEKSRRLPFIYGTTRGEVSLPPGAPRCLGLQGDMVAYPDSRVQLARLLGVFPSKSV